MATNDDFVINPDSASTLHRRAKIISDIFGLLVDYCSNIEDYMTKYSESDSTTWRNAKETIPKLIDECKKMLSDNSKFNNATQFLQHIYEIVNRFEACDSLLESSIRIATTRAYNEYITYNMSQTFGMNNEISKRRIVEMFHAYKSKIVLDEMAQVYSSLQSKVLNQIDDVVGFISSVERSNSFVIAVAARAIEKVPRTHTSTFVKKMEQLKIDTLTGAANTPVGIAPQCKDLHIVQQMTHRRGMYPATSYLGVAALFKELNREYNFDLGITENLSTIADANIVVIHKRTDKIIRYDIAPLISEEYVTANSLKSKPTAGLNERIIARFNTISAIDSTPPTKIPNVPPVERYEPSTANPNRWLLLECTQFKYYRILTAIGADGYYLTRAHIDNFLGELSMRPHVYNSIIESQILEHGLDERHRAIAMKYESAKLAAGTFKEVAAKVTAKAVELFRAEYLKSRPKNSRELHDLFVRPVLTIAYSDEIAQRMLEALVDNSPEYSVETGLSYISKIDELTTKFQREYTAIVASVFASGKILDSTIAGLEEEHALNQAVGWLTHVLSRALEDIDTGAAAAQQFGISLKEIARTFI